MKKIKNSIAVAVLVFAIGLTACSNDVPSHIDDTDTTSVSETPSEPRQRGFPPDLSRAYSIEIIDPIGRFEVAVVRRNDSAMMWNRDELPINHTGGGTPYIRGDFWVRNPTFENPNEYLFEALMDAWFDDRTYMPSSCGFGYGDWTIIIYDDEGAEIMTFDLFLNRNHCVRFNGNFYELSQDSRGFGEEIDWKLIHVAQFMARHLD